MFKIPVSGIVFNSWISADGKTGKESIVLGKNIAMNINIIINADVGGHIEIRDNVRIGPNVVIRATNYNWR